MLDKTLNDYEKDLYLAYIAKYGGGHSTVRQFRAFLINGQRASEGRRMIAGAQEEAKAVAMQSEKSAAIQVKPSAPLVPGQEPKKETAPVLPNKLQQPHQTGQGESGEVVAGGRIADIHGDIERGVSNTQMAAKYDKKELIECATLDGVTISADWSEKQIIAAIKKAVLPA